jgi:hypothetical protein
MAFSMMGECASTSPRSMGSACTSGKAPLSTCQSKARASGTLNVDAMAYRDLSSSAKPLAALRVQDVHAQAPAGALLDGLERAGAARRLGRRRERGGQCQSHQFSTRDHHALLLRDEVRLGTNVYPTAGAAG